MSSKKVLYEKLLSPTFYKFNTDVYDRALKEGWFWRNDASKQSTAMAVLCLRNNKIS